MTSNLLIMSALASDEQTSQGVHTVGMLMESALRSMKEEGMRPRCGCQTVVQRIGEKMPEKQQLMIDKILEYNSTKPATGSTSFLLYGKPGSGKSHMIASARRPIFIHSFDLGGTDIAPIQKGIKEGWIVVEHFEDEDPLDPKIWNEWSHRFADELTSGFFENFGTYAIDSMTNWVNAALYQRAKEAGRIGNSPQQQDWGIAANAVVNGLVRAIGKTPCDVILTAHVDKFEDQVTGRVMTDISVYKTLRKNIPVHIDEIYYMEAKNTAQGTAFTAFTKVHGSYYARSRRDELLSLEEEPNIKELLKKMGRKWEDAPALKLGG